MNRYSEILGNNPREIVLLKSLPCAHGNCAFCDYIDDNETEESSIISFDHDILTNVSGKFGKLEVINSASIFELPKEVWSLIRNTCIEKHITDLYFECHYMYKDRLNEVYDFFKGINITFKCGIETFDNNFRNKILKKGIFFNNPKEVSDYFKSICLLVGVSGQTKAMIEKDIDIALTYFDRVCINLFVNNSTPITADKKLQKWFLKKYSYLKNNNKVEILAQNTDFGVGNIEKSNNIISVSNIIFNKFLGNPISKTKLIALNALIAAIYVVASYAIAPIAYHSIQFRISELLNWITWLNPLSIWGLVIGCFIVNLGSPFGLVDVFFGTFATFLTVFFMSRTKNIYIASIYASIFSILIGIEFVLLNIPIKVAIIETLPIMLSEFVIMAIIGLPIMLYLNKKFNKSNMK